MKVLRVAALISLTAFFIACGSSDTNVNSGNGNRSTGNANGNRPATAANANANVAATNTNQPATAANIDAAALFVEQKCANCHGEDGKGKAKGAPDFTSAQWQSRESDEELAEQIRKGDPPKMPAFGSKLNEEQIKALVAYVRSFAK